MSNLFNLKEHTRSEKMKVSRGATTDLTREAIDWLNNTQQFHVNRSNNFPSPRITKTKAVFKYQDSNDDEQTFEYDDVKIHFKKNNIKEAILDISGFVLPYNSNRYYGRHLEIEVKTGKDSLSEEQILRIATIKAAGGISFVFDSMETLKIQIKPFMVEKKMAF